MRVPFGLFRAATRDPGVRLSAARGSNYPTPIPTAAGAVRRLHREGAQAAWQVLDRTYRDSPYWGTAGTPQARGWANAMREGFRRYMTWVQGDQRRFFDTRFTSELDFGGDVLGVELDVVLLAPGGYVGRLVLWSGDPLSATDAALVAAPCVWALEQELGDGRVAAAEIWHVRHAQRFSFTPSQVAPLRAQVRGLVNAVASG
jgi:hypothetical protein